MGLSLPFWRISKCAYRLENMVLFKFSLTALVLVAILVAQFNLEFVESSGPRWDQRKAYAYGWPISCGIVVINNSKFAPKHETKFRFGIKLYFGWFVNLLVAACLVGISLCFDRSRREHRYYFSTSQLLIFAGAFGLSLTIARWDFLIGERLFDRWLIRLFDSEQRCVFGFVRLSELFYTGKALMLISATLLIYEAIVRILGESVNRSK